MKYEKLVEVYDCLQATSKRLEKTKIISNLLKETSREDLPHIILLLQGKVFPSWDKQKKGVAARLILQSISVASGFPVQALEDKWKKTGDLGETAAECVAGKMQSTLFSETLSVEKVFSNLKKLASTGGLGAVDIKVKLVAELLTSASQNEAKYIVRTAMDELRIGVGDGILRDSIVWAFLYPAEYDSENNDLILESREEYTSAVGSVQNAFDILNDFPAVSVLAKCEGKEGLFNVEISIGRPMKVMLYQSAPNIADAMKRLGVPIAVEPKYDGFRMQIHKCNEEVAIFTRRLEDVSMQFPDVVEAARKFLADGIYDSEAVGIDPATGAMLPFQKISQRIKRKHGIKEMMKKFPVKVFVFDVLVSDGKSVISECFSDRRKRVEQCIAKNHIIIPSEFKIFEDEKDIANHYQKLVSEGYEGAMLKKLDAAYKPGSRVGYGMKIKPVLESLDAAITGAEWGEGKRAGWLTSFTLAVRNEDKFVEIGKVGTGIKEKEGEGTTFEHMTQILKPHIREERGRSVILNPSVVVEVHYEEIQKSPTYSSGFALRFPRLVRLRNDEKDASDCNTLEDVSFLYENQKGARSSRLE